MILNDHRSGDPSDHGYLDRCYFPPSAFILLPLNSMNIRPRRKSSDNNRRGVAATEFAVCLPVIVLLVLGMIECCTMIFLKQSLTVASYEGVRTALEERAVATDVRRTSQQILTQRRVRNGLITISPANIPAVPTGQFITVTVTAPADSNSVIPGSFFRGQILSASATMMKEL